VYVTHVIAVMIAGTSVQEMGLALAKSASAIHATSALTAFHYAQDMACAITTLVTVKVHGRVNTAKCPGVQTTVQETVYAIALCSRASVTQAGAGPTAVNLIVQVNPTVITEAHVQ